MKILLKHSRNRFFWVAAFFVFSLLAVSCSKEEKSAKNIAKVNNAVLTEDDLKNALSEERNSGKYRDEYIHEWIETEILFQQAEKEGLLKEKNFNSILEQSKKELASAIFINKILSDNNIQATEEEIKKYFEEKKEDFKLADNLYQLNIINFNNFDKAVQFRNTLIETDWNRALNIYRGEQSIIGSSSKVLLYKYQIEPLTLLRVISNLDENEISIVFETEPMKFTIVQLIQMVGKDVIPPFEIIKEEAKERLLVVKKKEFLKEYIDKLIADHNLEIVRYSE